jgi:acetyl esterase/lipase
MKTDRGIRRLVGAGMVALCLSSGFASGVAAQVAGMPEIRKALDAIGPEFTRETVGQTMGLYKARHPAGLPAGVTLLADQPYGAGPMQVLDVYLPEGADGTQPVVTFAHGGGFVRGDKAEVANVGAWLATQGFVAVVWNYRLAPEAVWPAGIEDQGAVIAWIAAHPELHHGDAAKIVLAGNSAGAMQVADYLWNGLGAPVSAAVIGAILLSPPVLNLTDHPLDPARDALWYGTDTTQYETRSALHWLGNTKVPVLLGWGEFDLPVVMAQSEQLLTGLLARDGHLPLVATAAGHNHISIVEHFGTGDATLEAPLAEFIQLQAARAAD